jgi:hypothetical protein
MPRSTSALGIGRTRRNGGRWVARFDGAVSGRGRRMPGNVSLILLHYLAAPHARTTRRTTHGLKISRSSPSVFPEHLQVRARVGGDHPHPVYCIGTKWGILPKGPGAERET